MVIERLRWRDRGQFESDGGRGRFSNETTIDQETEQYEKGESKSDEDIIKGLLVPIVEDEWLWWSRSAGKVVKD